MEQIVDLININNNNIIMIIWHDDVADDDKNVIQMVVS